MPHHDVNAKTHIDRESDLNCMPGSRISFLISQPRISTTTPATVSGQSSCSSTTPSPSLSIGAATAAAATTGAGSLVTGSTTGGRCSAFAQI